MVRALIAAVVLASEFGAKSPATRDATVVSAHGAGEGGKRTLSGAVDAHVRGLTTDAQLRRLFAAALIDRCRSVPPEVIAAELHAPELGWLAEELKSDLIELAENETRAKRCAKRCAAGTGSARARGATEASGSASAASTEEEEEEEGGEGEASVLFDAAASAERTVDHVATSKSVRRGARRGDGRAHTPRGPREASGCSSSSDGGVEAPVWGDNTWSSEGASNPLGLREASGSSSSDGGGGGWSDDNLGLDFDSGADSGAAGGGADDGAEGGGWSDAEAALDFDDDDDSCECFKTTVTFHANPSHI